MYVPVMAVLGVDWEDVEIDPIHACSCTICEETCPCVQRASGFPYTEGHLLQEERGNECSRPVYECWAACSCQVSCLTRGSQQGSPLLQVHHTGRKGLGVVTVNSLHQGSYVAEYYGEHIQEQRDGAYVFEAIEYFGLRESVWRVDAEFYGGVARFFNHSCQPNMLVVPVRTGYIVPRLCFFALRNIAAKEELTFRYRSKGSRHCECGEKECKGVF